MIDYSPDGIDETIARLQALETTWQGKQSAAKAPDLRGQGDTPRSANEVAKRYQAAYEAFLRLGASTRGFYTVAKNDIVAADSEAANQFEGH